MRRPGLAAPSVNACVRVPLQGKGETLRRARSAPAASAARTRAATPEETEVDEVRLANRQKQIDFGKNTLGYKNYGLLVPK